MTTILRAGEIANIVSRWADDDAARKILAELITCAELSYGGYTKAAKLSADKLVASVRAYGN